MGVFFEQAPRPSRRPGLAPGLLRMRCEKKGLTLRTGHETSWPVDSKGEAGGVY